MKTIVSALIALSVLAGIAALPRARSTPRASTSRSTAATTEPPTPQNPHIRIQENSHEDHRFRSRRPVVLAGIAAPVAASDTKTFYEQADRNHY